MAETNTVFNPAAIREFTPQNYDLGSAVCSPHPFPVLRTRLLTCAQTTNGVGHENGLYADPFTTMSTMGAALPPVSQYSLYAGDHSALAGPAAAFYPQSSAAFAAGPLQPPNYHLYQPFDSYRGELQPWQRTTYDFFLPQKMREDLQKKMFATLQVMPSKSRRHVSVAPGL